MIIQVLAATGQILYVFIWNSLGQVWNTNTLAFETYSAGNWAKYVVSCTEAASSGNYFATVPSQITAPGNYTFSAYIRLGASSAAGDTPIAPGSFTIAPAQPSGPLTTGLAALIYSLRALAQDTQVSKTAWQEMLGSSDQPAFPVNGVNAVFRLRKAPLADANGTPSYIWFTIVGNGAVTRSQSGITVLDAVNGIIQFTAAPNPGNGTYPTTPPNGVYVDYNYYWFTDTQYVEFLNRAAQMTLSGVSDPTAVQEGLTEVMLQYALAQFWYSRSSQYAEQYASSGGEAREDVQTAAQAYKSLGDAAAKRGDYLKKDFYQHQGQRDQLASVTKSYGIDPITPMR